MYELSPRTIDVEWSLPVNVQPIILVRSVMTVLLLVDSAGIEKEGLARVTPQAGPHFTGADGAAVATDDGFAVGTGDGKNVGAWVGAQTTLTSAIAIDVSAQPDRWAKWITSG